MNVDIFMLPATLPHAAAHAHARLAVEAKAAGGAMRYDSLFFFRANNMLSVFYHNNTLL
ncbi:MAG: hypothetical protein LBG47_00940 [Prevotellaceae bacterium]|jgi:hypothetical protein|nr:hypothetical protein [Prevotellaceae bacterium]